MRLPEVKQTEKAERSFLSAFGLCGNFKPPTDEQCSVLADRRFGLRMTFVDIASARLCPAVLFEIFPLSK